MKITKTTFLVFALFTLPFLAVAQQYQPFGIPGVQTANDAVSFKQDAEVGLSLSFADQAEGLTGHFQLMSIRWATGDTVWSTEVYHTGGLQNFAFLTSDPNEGDTCTTYLVASVVDTALPYVEDLEQYTIIVNPSMLGWTALESQVPIVSNGMQTDTTYTTGVFTMNSIDAGFGANVVLEPQGTIPGFSSGTTQVVGLETNVEIPFSVANPGQTGMVRARATSIQGITVAVSDWMPFATLQPGEPEASLDTVLLTADEMDLMVDLIAGDVSGTYVWQIFEPNNQSAIFAGGGGINSTTTSIPIGTSPTLDAATAYTVELTVNNSSPNSPFVFTWEITTADLDDITASILSVTSTPLEVCAEVVVNSPGQPSILMGYIPELGNMSLQSVSVPAGTDTFTICVPAVTDSMNITFEAFVEGVLTGQDALVSESHTTFDSDLGLQSFMDTSGIGVYGFTVNVTSSGVTSVTVNIDVYTQANPPVYYMSEQYILSPAPGTWSLDTILNNLPNGEGFVVVVEASDTNNVETLAWPFGTPQEIVEEVATGNIQMINEIDQVFTFDYVAYLNNGGLSTVTTYIGETSQSIITVAGQQTIDGSNGVSHMGLDTIDYSSYAAAGWNRIYFIVSITSPQGIEYFAGNHNFYDIPEENEPEPLYGPIIVGSTQGSIGETHASIRYKVNPRDSANITGYLEVLPAGEPMITTDPMPFPVQMENMWQILDLTPGTDHEYRIVLTDQYGNDFMWGDYFLFTTEEEVIVDPNGIEEILTRDYNAVGLLYNDMGQLMDGSARLQDYRYGHELGMRRLFWVGKETRVEINPRVQ
jgi:hypothetical protein